MLIHQAHTQFKVPVSVLCRRFGIPRASFYRQSEEKDHELLDRIKHIAFKHPSWGYRMILAELRIQGVRVKSQKALQALHFCEFSKTCYAFR